MLIFPTEFQLPRGIILLILLVSSFEIAKTRFHVNKETAGWWAITMIVSVFSLLWGGFHGNPGALVTWTVAIAWPMLYFYLAGCCNSMKTIEKLLVTIVNIGLVVVIMNIIFLANAFFLNIGIINQIGEALDFRYYMEEGFFEFRTPSQSLMTYILFFTTTLLLLNHKYLNIGRSKLVLSVVLCLIAILLSRRRSMWVMVIVLPFFELAFLAFYDVKSRKIISNIGKILGVCLIGIVILYYGISIFLDSESLYLELLSSFDFSDNDSNYERTLQARSLLVDFMESPIIGKGAGFVSSYVRTPDFPWQYELTYNYKLAELGIIGFSIYLLATLWIFIKSRTIIAKRHELITIILPQLSGLMAFLIINETNPYMNKFDFLWVLFLPVVSINTILKTSNSTKQR